VCNNSTKKNYGIIVDSGYSFTYVVPIWDSQKVNRGIKRINVGGKLLTNVLKETVTFRTWVMTDEILLMNHIKEQLCFVSQDFLSDLKICKAKDSTNTIKRNFVLPDGVNSIKGYIKKDGEEKKPEEQVLVMNNERIAIPEILFNPSDISINQAGIPETIVQAVNSTELELQGLLYSNIILTGGNVLYPGFKERLYKELRAITPSTYPINISIPDDPISTAWFGGTVCASLPNLTKISVTKAEYNENGPIICHKKFS